MTPPSHDDVIPNFTTEADQSVANQPSCVAPLLSCAALSFCAVVCGTFVVQYRHAISVPLVWYPSAVHLCDVFLQYPYAVLLWHYACMVLVCDNLLRCFSAIRLCGVLLRYPCAMPIRSTLVRCPFAMTLCGALLRWHYPCLVLMCGGLVRRICIVRRPSAVTVCGAMCVWDARVRFLCAVPVCGAFVRYPCALSFCGILVKCLCAVFLR